MCLSVLCYICTCFQYQCCICTHLRTYIHIVYVQYVYVIIIVH